MAQISWTWNQETQHLVHDVSNMVSDKEKPSVSGLLISKIKMILCGFFLGKKKKKERKRVYYKISEDKKKKVWVGPPNP